MNPVIRVSQFRVRSLSVSFFFFFTDWSLHITACNTISVFLIKLSLGLSTCTFFFFFCSLVFFGNGSFHLKGLALARVHLLETARRLGCSITEQGAVWHLCHVFYKLPYQQPKKTNPKPIFITSWRRGMFLITMGIKSFCQIAKLFVILCLWNLTLLWHCLV